MAFMSCLEHKELNSKLFYLSLFVNCLCRNHITQKVHQNLKSTCLALDLLSTESFVSEDIRILKRMVFSALSALRPQSCKELLNEFITRKNCTLI